MIQKSHGRPTRLPYAKSSRHLLFPSGDFEETTISPAWSAPRNTVVARYTLSNYRARDIDLLVVARQHRELIVSGVEVKADRNHQTGNFFVETVSDLERRTPGAFLVSRADWFFYYFVHPQILWCLPLETLRTWTLDQTRRVQSSRGNRSWKTEGLLVPYKRMEKEIAGVEQFSRSCGGWNSIREGGA